MMLVGALTLSFQSLTPPTGLRKVEWESKTRVSRRYRCRCILRQATPSFSTIARTTTSR